MVCGSGRHGDIFARMVVSVERSITIGYERYANGIDRREYSRKWLLSRELQIYMISASYRPKKKFMQLAITEAKRARDRGDYPIGAVITRLMGRREVVIASAGNRVKTSGSSIKHVELETLKYVSSGYGRYLPDFVLYSTHEPCAMCAGACVWARIGAVVYGVSQEDIAAYGRKRGTEDYKWRACLIPCRLVFAKGNHRIPVTGGFLRQECQELFSYRPS